MPVTYIKTDCATVDDAGAGSVSVNVNQSVIIDVRCQYQLTMQLAADAANNASSSVIIDSVVLLPDYRRSNVYTDAGSSLFYY